MTRQKRTVSVARRIQRSKKPDPQNKEERHEPVSLDGKIAIGVEELVPLLGISRTTAYALVRQPDFPSFTVGHRVLISLDGLKKWIAQRCEIKDEIPLNSRPDNH